MYNEMGEKLDGLLLHLVCKKCGATIKPGAPELTSCLRTGWPECCGEIMYFMTKREASGQLVP